MSTRVPLLPHHMRLAALQCNFEGGRDRTLAVPGLWREFGFNVEQLFHAYAQGYSAAYDPARDLAPLAEYVAESRRRGLGTLLYLNCHILMPSEEPRFPEWAQVRRDGQYTKLYDTYCACCLNSTWVADFLSRLDTLRDLPIAGIFFDGPFNAPCHCPRCDARFRREHGKPVAEAADAEAAAFGARAAREFICDSFRKVKAVNPRWVSYMNLPVLHAKATAAELQEIVDCNDIVGTEGGFQFYGPPRDIDIWRCGAHARVLDAVAGRKPKVIFMAGDHKPWSWYLHTPAETKLCYASTLANGASVWYGIHGSTDYLRSPSGEAAREMVQFDRTHDALYARTQSLADVAVFLSLDTRRHYAARGEATDFYASGDTGVPTAIGDCSRAFNGAFGMLFRANAAFDVVTELNLADLRRHRVLLLPQAACLSDAACAALRAWVRRGGVLVADADSSLYDEGFRRRADFGLADVFGASFLGFRAYHNHDYFECEAGFNRFGAERPLRLPAPTAALAVEPHAGTEVAARLLPPLAGRYSGVPGRPELPFVLRRRTGRGEAWFLAGTFFELYGKYGPAHHARFVGSVVREHARPVAELLGAPPSVEFTVRRAPKAGCTAVHLVNYSGGMQRPVERPIRLHGLALKLGRPFAKARALVAGRALRVRRDGTVALPPLGEFEVVTLT